jgi:hypothetical protein
MCHPDSRRISWTPSVPVRSAPERDAQPIPLDGRRKSAPRTIPNAVARIGAAPGERNSSQSFGAERDYQPPIRIAAWNTKNRSSELNSQSCTDMHAF